MPNPPGKILGAHPNSHKYHILPCWIHTLSTSFLLFKADIANSRTPVPITKEPLPFLSSNKAPDLY